MMYMEEIIKDTIEVKVKKNKSKKNKKKMWIWMALVILVVAGIVIAGIKIKEHMDEDKIIVDGTNSMKNVTGKLADYIKGLGDNYYIRYIGEIGKKSLNEDLVEGTVEYTQNSISTAIYSEAINMRVVTDGQYTYNIADKYRLILKAKLPIRFETEEYNLISDFGQKYVADVKTKVADVDYIYQEYIWNDAKIRYYFVGEDLRYIRIVVGENDRKINIRVDRHTKNDLFEVPKDYILQAI